MSWNKVSLLLLLPVTDSQSYVFICHLVEILVQPEITDDVDKSTDVEDKLIERHKLRKGKFKRHPRVKAGAVERPWTMKTLLKIHPIERKIIEDTNRLDKKY